MAIDIRRLTRLAIGINTENGVEEYRFDMWPWLEEHPQLNEFQINVTPPGGMPYKAQTHMDGFYLVWPITSRDTALPGDDGWYEVEAFGEGGLHKLSPKKPLVVYERMAGDLGEAPETIKTWVEEAYEVLDSSKTATEAANAAASAANNAAAKIKTATNTTLGVVKGGPGILIGEDGRLEGKRPVTLLDNNDFRNGYFIAQAGKNGMHGDTKYAGDRWISWDADAAFADGYMTPGSPIDQRLPLDRFDLDKIYTVAYCMPDGTIRASSDYLTNGAGSYAFGMHAIAELGYVRVRLMTGFSMQWADLYEGSYTADTLPDHQPKGYAAELAECQRYYWEEDVDAPAFTSYYLASSFTQFPVQMRTIPTVIIESHNGTGDKVTNVMDGVTEVSVVTAAVTKQNLLMGAASGGFVANTRYRYKVKVSADM